MVVSFYTKTDFEFELTFMVFCFSPAYQQELYKYNRWLRFERCVRVGSFASLCDPLCSYSLHLCTRTFRPAEACIFAKP